MKDKLEILRNLVAIQGSAGNWDYSEYMRGMFNGMELMLATLEDRQPEFKPFNPIPILKKEG